MLHNLQLRGIALGLVGKESTCRAGDTENPGGEAPREEEMAAHSSILA